MTPQMYECNHISSGRSRLHTRFDVSIYITYTVDEALLRLCSDGRCSSLWRCGSAAIDGLAFQQDDGQVQILTVGHGTTEEGEAEPVMSCAHSQSKQDLRVTMLKKGTVSVPEPFCHCFCSSLTTSSHLHPRRPWCVGRRVRHMEIQKHYFKSQFLNDGIKKERAHHAYFSAPIFENYFSYPIIGISDGMHTSLL